MAETRRVSSARPSPAARRRTGSRPAQKPASPVPVRLVAAPSSKPARRSGRPAPAPPRTGTELLVMTVLVLGLALNALALLRHAALSGADMLLGATVLLAGVTLLVLMEVYRRG